MTIYLLVATDFTKMLEIKNLSIRYKNTDSLVLDDISFQINSNQKIAIL
jgi:ABC-type transport system involved in cytochrome bd biosynthesis fused ATPase/permease subunit